MFYYQKSLRSDLHIFLGTVAALIVIGLVFIYSASSVYALEKFGSSHYFVKRQALGLILGIIAMAVTRFFPLALLKRLSPYLFLATLGLTSLTLIPSFSVNIHGSSRWLQIGGLSFQPSELLKIAFIMYIAYFLSKKEQRRSSFLHTYIPFLIILFLSCGVLLRQPDFGLSVSLFITAFLLAFIVELQNKHIFSSIVMLIPIGGLLVLYKPYRMQRILTFLNPWADPQGAGFQIIQSLIAIGSGSFWGTGIAHSKQKFFYLPMQHTDFIFSIIAEETGFIGSFFIIFLFMLFLYFGMRLLFQMRSPFCRYALCGFVLLISLQAIINIAVASGMAPTKGLGLPFVSYGNTCLVCYLMIIGLIINMVYNEHTI